MMATTLNFTQTLKKYPESLYLLDRFLRYMLSEKFEPSDRIEPAALKNLIDKSSKEKQIKQG